MLAGESVIEFSDRYRKFTSATELAEMIVQIAPHSYVNSNFRAKSGGYHRPYKDSANKQFWAIQG